MPEKGEEAVYVYEPERCPLTATLGVIGGKWKGLLWWRLRNGLARHGQLRRSIPQITSKMLTQQLRDLERDGIVTRRVYPEVPLRVEYELTEYGRSLEPVIDAICAWGERHLATRDPPLTEMPSR